MSEPRTDESTMAGTIAHWRRQAALCDSDVESATFLHCADEADTVLAAEREAATPPLDALILPRELLESLVDDEECRFDHHGGCQAHGYLSLEPGELCPQADLKGRLAQQDGTEE